MNKTANYEGLLTILGGVTGAAAGGWAGRKVGGQGGIDFGDLMSPGSSKFNFVPGSISSQYETLGKNVGMGTGAAGGGLAGMIAGLSLARSLPDKEEPKEKENKKPVEKIAENIMNKEAKQRRDAYLVANIVSLQEDSMEKEAAVAAANTEAAPEEGAQVKKKNNRTTMETLIRNIYGVGGALTGATVASELVNKIAPDNTLAGVGATMLGAGTGLAGGLTLNDYLAKTASEETQEVVTAGYLAGYMQKEATRPWEIGGQFVSNAVEGATGIPVGSVGGLVGIGSDYPTPETIMEREEDKGFNLIPGVGNFRMGQRVLDSSSRDLIDILDKAKAKDGRKGLQALAKDHPNSQVRQAATEWLTQKLEKSAGPYSEIASGLNPLNIVGTPIAALVAALTSHRSRKEQLATEDSTWKNLLIPGVGPYNAIKRNARILDRRIDRPLDKILEKGDIKSLEKLESTDKNRAVRERASEYKQKALAEKEAGARSETFGMFSPLSAIGATPGMLLSALTPTRKASDQVASEEDLWKNILVPGVGGYNAGKRLGRTMHTDLDQYIQDRVASKGRKGAEELAAGSEGESLAQRAQLYLDDNK